MQGGLIGEVGRAGLGIGQERVCVGAGHLTYEVGQVGGAVTGIGQGHIGS
ncbi:hypothetical protein [Streptomyces cirratus]